MYDLDWLLARTARKQKMKYLYFWGHRPTANGTLSGSCLSQWWASPFKIDGVRYATAEHWMMAGKARLFGDDGAADRIVAASHPDCAKRLGREVRGFDQDRWDAHRFNLVVEGNRAKFSQHPDLKEFLLDTGKRVLVEASPVDRIWGVGLAADDDRITDPHAWRGLNLLGFALMTVRDELAETTSPEPGGHTILNTRINDKLPADALHE